MIDVKKIQTALFDESMQLGIFETVNGYEPKSPPGNGVNTAFWMNQLTPIQASGLDVTSVRLVFDQRIYVPMLQEPQDNIDPAILDATQQVMNAYCNSFTLLDQGGVPLVRMVDLLGASGPGLDAKAGYLQQSDKIFRAMVITLPLIINDVFQQEA